MYVMLHYINIIITTLYQHNLHYIMLYKCNVHEVMLYYINRSCITSFIYIMLHYNILLIFQGQCNYVMLY